MAYNWNLLHLSFHPDVQKEAWCLCTGLYLPLSLGPPLQSFLKETTDENNISWCCIVTKQSPLMVYDSDTLY
jgi:hypothetical protein